MTTVKHSKMAAKMRLLLVGQDGSGAEDVARLISSEYPTIEMYVLTTLDVQDSLDHWKETLKRALTGPNAVHGALICADMFSHTVDAFVRRSLSILQAVLRGKLVVFATHARTQVTKTQKHTYTSTSAVYGHLRTLVEGFDCPLYSLTGRSNGYGADESALSIIGDAVQFLIGVSDSLLCAYTYTLAPQYISETVPFSAE